VEASRRVDGLGLGGFPVTQFDQCPSRRQERSRWRGGRYALCEGEAFGFGEE